MGHSLARRAAPFKCEWFVNGEWIDDQEWTLALEDALIDYGAFSVMDADRISLEMAEKLIQNGTIVLKGNIGYGTFYDRPETIQLSNWKRPAK